MAETSRYEIDMQKCCGVDKVFKRADDFKKGIKVPSDGTPRPMLARQLPMHSTASETVETFEDNGGGAATPSGRVRMSAGRGGVNAKRVL